MRIAGWIDFNENLLKQEDVMEAMSQTLSRRGPDARGVYFIPERRFGSSAADRGGPPKRQAAHGTAERFGALHSRVQRGAYNTEDIRRELLTLGHVFAGHSDTEVLLAAFTQWGEECVHRLNGIYAFAVWGRK